ncbi:hypothetical protein C2845_PM12G10610 [Panicum miliaceum]|uniref:Reverse transcriptase n=1 Tax=Panicum miliaceum TaxID=4540 RepID=A0A3L6QI94_PANMI|nr:hypothetical protein C2845_PM12G10610 [Panicum miliaceum]
MAVKSDHCPILLSFEPEEKRETIRGLGRPFRYELMWETNKGLPSLIQQVWKEGQHCNYVKDMKDKLCHLGEEFRSWGQSTFGAVRKGLREQKKRLEQLRCDPTRNNVSEEEKKLVERISLLNYQEEIIWRQRSRITWLREGDSNTRFFHQKASRRRSRNRIIRLNRPDGTECTKVEEMHAMVMDFYSNLFKSEGTSNMCMVLNHVPRKVTNEMNKFLCAPFDESEVKNALFQMFPTKAPGPDDFPAHFFQRNWDLCGEDLTRMVLRVLNGDEIPTEINSTFIVLIPKVQNPVCLS